MAAKARVLIVSLDELGFCQAANAAIYAALRDHRATSASLMVPAPWARAAAFDYEGEDLGVHLTLNSEHRSLSLRSDHTGSVVARWRRRLLLGLSPMCGNTPISMRSIGSGGPRSSGRCCGALR